MSPKRSPAPQPPASPLVPERINVFSFPTRGAPTPSPVTPHQQTSSSSSSWCGTPPPLPPRRRRDSAAPHTPLHAPSSNAAVGGASPVYGTAGSAGATTAPSAPSAATAAPSSSSAPPPLPPRPAPAPALLRPAHSTILQRRHNTAAPRLPPKPGATLSRT